MTVTPARFRPVLTADAQRWTAYHHPPDLALRSASAIGADSALPEPAPERAVPTRPRIDQPEPTSGSVELNPWRTDRDVSWYGPGFYGNRTACGQTLTTTIVGVAHRSLPCGTPVVFRNPANGIVVRATVIDRGPYVSGRHWDLSAGLCRALDHCYTGTLNWKYG
jgi:rare lipoprotein A (peptidoglycan hydrolase)